MWRGAELFEGPCDSVVGKARVSKSSVWQIGRYIGVAPGRRELDSVMRVTRAARDGRKEGWRAKCIKINIRYDKG